MPSLQVRELPQPLFEKLKKEAKKEHRTLSQQAIVTLAKGLEQSISQTEKRKKLLEMFREESIVADVENPVKLIRKDRDK